MWWNFCLRAHRLAHPPTALRLALVTEAALACTLLFGPIAAADPAKPSSQAPPHQQLIIPPAEAMKP